ncbi:MAG: YceD family protein [Rhodospirillaceae bacterium]
MAKKGDGWISLLRLNSGSTSVLSRDVVFSDDQCAILADRFGLLVLEQLTANFKLTLGEKAGWINVSGKGIAEFQQTCVATLRPLKQSLNLEMELLLVPEETSSSDVFGELDFEYYSGNEIDLSEILAVELGLEINPYPRSVDADLSAIGPQISGFQVSRALDSSPAREQEAERPFSDLEMLQKKD